MLGVPLRAKRTIGISLVQSCFPISSTFKRCKMVRLLLTASPAVLALYELLNILWHPVIKQKCFTIAFLISPPLSLIKLLIAPNLEHRVNSAMVRARGSLCNARGPRCTGGPAPSVLGHFVLAYLIIIVFA